MPATATYPLTGNAYIDALLGGRKWAVDEFTFSFPTDGSFYGAGYGSGEPTNNFGSFNATQQAAARASLGMFSSVAKLEFTQIGETSTRHADLRLAMSDAPITAWAYLPSTAAEGGDSWFNKSSGYFSSPVKGNYAYTTFLHEIGHALGLHHSHEGNVMPMDRDSMEYTVMSYRSYVGASLGGGYTNEKWGYAQSLMMYDIAALQHMYGADYVTNSGNTTYSWSPTTGEMSINGIGQGAPGANRIFLTVWDGGGADTYDFSSYSTALSVDLRPGGWTTTSSTQLAKLHYDGSKVAAGNIANALLHEGDTRSMIENARGGSGDDRITGNTAANTMWGNRGNDRLAGGDGNDRLLGGTGNDHLIGGNGADVVQGDAGTDHMYGGKDNDRLYAGSGDDFLFGDAGHDLLDGSGGADRYDGGAGNDRLYTRNDDMRDIFVFDPGTGSDRIFRYEEDVDWLYVDAAFGYASGTDVINNAPAAYITDGGEAIIALNGDGDVIQIIDYTILNPGKTITHLADDILIA